MVTKILRRCLLGMIVCIVFSAVIVTPREVFASLYEEKDDFLIWHCQSDMDVIYGYIGKDTDVIIPKSISGAERIIIDKDAFLNNETMETITIPNNISIIREGAFNGCTSLQEVIFKENESSRYDFDDMCVETNAFINCDDLEKVVIRERKVDLDDNAFGNEDNITFYTKYGYGAHSYIIESSGESIFLRNDGYAREGEIVSFASSDERFCEEGITFDGEIITSGEEYEKVTADVEGKAFLYHVEIKNADGNDVDYLDDMKMVLDVPGDVNYRGYDLYRVEDDGTKTLLSTKSFTWNPDIIGGGPNRTFTCEVEKAGTFLLVTAPIYGDTDGNGRLEAKDALEILKTTVNLHKLDKYATFASDVTGDGAVNAEDALMILQRVVKINEWFPIDHRC